MAEESSIPTRHQSQILEGGSSRPSSRLNPASVAALETRSMPSSPRLMPRRNVVPTGLSSSTGLVPPLPPPYHHHQQLQLHQVLQEYGGVGNGREGAGNAGKVSASVNWQEKCLELEVELQRSRSQATRTRDMLREKLSELEQRVLDAEGRAEEAEDKVRIMEQKLAWSQQQQQLHHSDGPGSGGVGAGVGVGADSKTGAQINQLQVEVQEQRQLRLQDARQVEAKAARIKEWVTNKLRELEIQNQTLREQNIRCNQQLELLRNHLLTSADRRRRSESCSPEPTGGTATTVASATAHCGVVLGSAVPTGVVGGSVGVGAATGGGLRSGAGSPSSRSNRHRRHQSVCLSASTYSTSHTPPPPTSNHLVTTSAQFSAAALSSSMDATTTNGGNSAADRLCMGAVDELSASADNRLGGGTGKGGASRAGGDNGRVLSSASDSDLAHDYAEIYTPSREKVQWPPRAPTPPLHRFPSWEDRIYQVAADGLTLTGTTPSDVGPEHAGYQDIPVPVYATVKGRASQIRSMPFTGDSSDDSSDGEGNNTAAIDGTTHSRSSGDTTGSSPGKRTASSSSGSPSKSKTRGVSDTSFESGMSDDYAVPPDAVSCGGGGVGVGIGGGTTVTVADNTSLESNLLLRASSYLDSPKRTECLEKSGSLAKLGGKLKTWRKRWFVLKNGVLTYYKNQSDINRKPQGQILLDEICKITRADGSNTFEIDTGKKTYYLTADSITAMEDWVRILQSVQRKNATKFLLSKEENKPTVQGWLTKVKNGHAKKCWCVLIGKMFLYFKAPTDATPAGQITMRDARVEEVEHLSDSDSEEKGNEQRDLTVGIFPSNQGPTYLICPSKQDKDAWLYHLTVASGGGPSTGTQYEQLIHKLMEVDGDANCVLWRHPVLLYVPCTKDGALPSYFPLTTLTNETSQAEAIKLFKCLQLFMSAAVDQAGIDYHVVLAQNALQQCLDMPELQSELICALIKQTSKGVPLPKLGVQVSTQKLLKKGQLLLCATQSLFTCEVATPSINSAASEQQIASLLAEHTNNTISPPNHPQGSATLSQSALLHEAETRHSQNTKDHHKEYKDHKGPPAFTLLQGWQLLALAVSLIVPKSSRLLWFLKLHLQRNTDNRTECGKYAAYCERALERTILMGGRELKPSRMEVLSILLKNPQHHALPHSMPVHLANLTYHISSFDGSSTIREFQDSFAHEIGCRVSNGFALFSDDPIEKDLEHTLDPAAKLCDLISRWEIALREKGLGKFENSKVIRLTYKSRLWWKNSAKLETDKERLLLCYQVNKQVVSGRFPLSRELALELASLMAQLDMGECSLLNNKNNRPIGGGSSTLPNKTSISSHPSPKLEKNGTSNNTPKHINTNTAPPATCPVVPTVQNSNTLNALHNVHNILAAHSNQALSAIDKFYPYRYRDQLSHDGLADLQAKLLEKWRSLKGRSQLDCVRIYLTCTRKWPFFGATLFQAKLRQHESPMIWIAVNDDSVTCLELATMQQRDSYPYTSVLTFGGCQEDFMLVVTQTDTQPQHQTQLQQITLAQPQQRNSISQKLIFSLSKPKILELTLLIADYMNLLMNNPGTPLLGTLSRGTMVSVKQSAAITHSLVNQAMNAQSQPDILKSTPDHGVAVQQRADSKRRTHVDSGLA